MASLIRNLSILAALIACWAPAARADWQDLVADRGYLRIDATGGIEINQPAPGQTVYFWADVSEFGFTASVPVPYRVFLDGALFCTGLAPMPGPVGPSGSWSLMCGQGWQATAGTHIVRWDLNYDSSIPEADNRNNSVLDVFTVAPSTTVPTADIVAKRVYFLSALTGGAEVPRPAAGQTLYMAIDWETKGSGGPLTFMSRVGVDAAYVDCGNLNLSTGVAVPQSYTSVCARPWVVTPGLVHVLSWQLDYSGGVPETAEWNNSASMTFNAFVPGAAPTIDIRIDRVFLSPADSATLGGVESPFAGQKLDVYVVTAFSGFTGWIVFNTLALLDGVPASCSGPWGLSDQTRLARCALTWTATPGTHTFQIQFDSDNAIPETDETNNTGTLTFTVGATGAPNLALGKATSESSLYGEPYDSGSQRAVDGSTDGDFTHLSLSSTKSEPNAWWQVDLGDLNAIGAIKIWNRTDCCASRLSDYWVFASDAPFTAADTPATLQNRPGIFASHQTSAPNPSSTILVDAPGRYVRVQLSGTGYLTLAEVQVSGKVTLTVSHKGDFFQGQPTAQYTLQVQNPYPVSLTGTVTVTDLLPPTLTPTSIAGPGWACVLATLTCSRSDTIAAAANWPPITLTVKVAPVSPPGVTNTAVVSGVFPATTASDATVIQPAFQDVNLLDPFLPAIDLLREAGVTTGCATSPPAYCPGDNIPLAQMAVFVVRSVVGNDNFSYSATPYFTDVPASHPYFRWIQKMQELGIAVPCAAGQYCPDTAVTRGVMALLIVRARLGAPLPGAWPATPYFTDVPATHLYFPWVQKMKQLGITAGCSADLYCPGDPVTRGQMAVFLMRGAFNQLLPAGTAVLTWVSSGSLPRGNSVMVTITGENTHFASGPVLLTAGDGVTVTNLTVVNGTTLTARLTVAPNAAAGPRSLTATTGTEEATLPNGFVVW